MILELWARKWGIPDAAVADYRRMLGMDGDHAPPLLLNQKPGSEAQRQQLCRLEAPRFGAWLTRNNVGALKDKDGRVIRFGLANESADQNSRFKSSDLIGLRSILITHEHVGCVIGQFVAREMKEQGWTYNSSDKHEAAQKAFIDFINSKGGDACFATGEGSFNETPALRSQQ